MNEQSAREKMLREQRIQKEARADGYAEGFSAGLSRAEESYSPRMTRLERAVAALTLKVKALLADMSSDETRVAPMIRNPNRSTGGDALAGDAETGELVDDETD